MPMTRPEPPDPQPEELSEEAVAALTARLADGDQQALAELFSAYWQRLQRMVYFRLDVRLKGRVDPDDILQESWLAAQQRIGSFDPERNNNVFVWLRLMVGQTMIDVHRRHLGSKMRSAGQEVSLQRFAGPAATSASMSMLLLGNLTSPSQAAAKVEFAELLDRILEDMEPMDREILMLRHFEELSNKEVAELLDIQRSTASNRYVRALKRLKDILNKVPGIGEEPPAEIGPDETEPGATGPADTEQPG